MTAIRHRTTLDRCHRERRPNAEFYLRSLQEQAERFAAYHPQAAANSVRIARRCVFDLTEDLGYRLPSPAIEGGERTPQEELARICRERLRERYLTSPPGEQEQARQRLDHELKLVEQHELAGFFLIYHEVLKLATEVAAEIRGPSAGRSQANMPPGRGRGSSVASIICYLIGLSHIDPIKNKLSIGRFLNEAMRTFPDIDLDFARDIRAKLIERVYDRWGKEYAALVAIFPTYRARSALRDTGKALGLPAAEIDRLAKRSNPHEGSSQIPAELARHPEFAGRLEERGWRDLADLAQQLAGFPRHLSQHVGGMVISSQPLIDYVPCQPAAWPSRYLCHWDKDSVDDARMVKIDFLALGMLSAVEEAVDLVEQHDGVSLDLSRIPYEDADVYDDICRGDTVGVFQIESRAQIAMLPRTQPRNLDDLTVQVSIVRPGPIVGGAVNPYVRECERQRRDPRYRPPMPHACVAGVLEQTLGVVLFQEQVVEVARAMGGFTAGEAEQFRRAMSRKRSLETMERYRDKFMAGARARSVPPAAAERLFENLLGFAEFGFPKSHGAAFGLLAYQTTWLKRYHPAPFFCALFNNQPMGFYPPHVLTNDAKRHHIELRRPDINVSAAACTVEEPDTSRGEGRGAVRVGLGYVHGVGEAGGRRAEQERAAAGPFASLFDFVQRTGLSREATANLISIGAFGRLRAEPARADLAAWAVQRRPPAGGAQAAPGATAAAATAHRAGPGGAGRIHRLPAHGGRLRAAQPLAGQPPDAVPAPVAGRGRGLQPPPALDAGRRDRGGRGPGRLPAATAHRTGHRLPAARRRVRAHERARQPRIGRALPRRCSHGAVRAGEGGARNSRRRAAHAHRVLRPRGRSRRGVPHPGGQVVGLGEPTRPPSDSWG